MGELSGYTDSSHEIRASGFIGQCDTVTTDKNNHATDVGFCIEVHNCMSSNGTTSVIRIKAKRNPKPSAYVQDGKYRNVR
jgi:hypothetical protein